MIKLETNELKPYTIGRKENIMETLLGLIFLFCVFGLPAIVRNYKFNNNLPPEGYQTDWSAMNRDLANGMSKTEVMNKSNNGGYYVKKK